MAQTVLLDLNAISDLFRDSDRLTPEVRDELRNELRVRTANHSLRVLATGELFDEMLGIEAKDLFHKVRRELYRLSHGRISTRN